MQNEKLPPVLVIFGPTSSGKTSLSLALADCLPTALGQEVEIVNADSRQVYVGMNIGTSKVGRETMLRVPHHGLDMRPPDRMVSLVEYQTLAVQRITEIHARGHLPVMVGGTGSYILSVVENWNVGEELLAGEENFRNRGKGDPRLRAAFVRPATDLKTILRRIDRAVETMFASGLVEEVVCLAERYRLWEPARLNKNALWHTHGYREFLELAHTFKPVRLQPAKCDLPGIMAAIQEHTRAYALRQWSWLKKMPPVKPVSDGKGAAAVVKELLAEQS
jgi:tRNA A37 N6-isopentenylltransferase MiaA